MIRPGTQIDRFRLVERLGSGGQAEVWRAEDRLEPGVMRALKLLPVGDGGASLERVRREGRLLAKLRHPSLPRCFGLFEDLEEEVLGITMELVEGITLAEALADPRWTGAHAEWVLRHLAGAVTYVHAEEITHRDVKPANVILAPAFFEHPDERAHVRLVDFGVAWQPATKGLTQVGRVVGTPRYMAPEQLHRQGAPPSAASDVFGWGLVAWELLVGGHPLEVAEEPDLEEVAAAFGRARKEATWPAAIDHRWGRVVARCLALHPEDRPTAKSLNAVLAKNAASPPGRTAEHAPPSEEPSTITSAPKDEPPPTDEALPPRRSWLGPLALVLLVVGGYVAFRNIDAITSLATPTSSDARATTGEGSEEQDRRDHVGDHAGGSTPREAAHDGGNDAGGSSGEERGGVDRGRVAAIDPAHLPARCAAPCRGCCAMGKSCGGPCNEDLPLDERFLLRLHTVAVERASGDPTNLHDAKVLVRLARGRSPWTDLADGEQAIAITPHDLQSSGTGLDVRVVDAKGTTRLEWHRVRRTDRLTRENICAGVELKLAFSWRHTAVEETRHPKKGPGAISSVTFHLDPPEGPRPKRCPSAPALPCTRARPCD